MIITSNNHTDLSSGVLDESAFSFEMNGIAAYTLMSGIARDKIAYPIRELCTNAWDVAQGDFEVRLPTRWDSTFAVRDYGPGLSHELMQTIYTRFFASTKRDSNEQVGGLGLGCKSPFAYLINDDKAASYMVRSFQGGRVRTYTMSLSATGLPVMRLLDDSETDERSGLEVSFTVRLEDLVTFTDKTREILWSFPDRPTIVPSFDYTEPVVIKNGFGWTRYQYGTVPFHGPHVRMGCVMYPIDLSSVKTSGFINSTDAILFDARIGSLTVQTSRESLGYDDKTKATLSSLVDAYEREFLDQIRKQVQAAPSYFEAVRQLVKEAERLGYRGFERLQNDILWKDDVFLSQTVKTAKVCLLPRGWKGWDKFSRHIVQISRFSSDAVIAIEHNPNRSYERFVKADLVGKEILWVRLTRDELPEFLHNHDLSADDVIIIDDVKLEGRPVARTKDIKRKRTYKWHRSNLQGELRSSFTPIDMNEGGVYLIKGGDRRFPRYTLSDTVTLGESDLHSLLYQWYELNITNEPLHVLSLSESDSLSDDWFFVGDYMELRIRDLIDRNQITAIQPGSNLYSMNSDLRKIAEAKWDLSLAPIELAEAVAAAKEIRARYSQVGTRPVSFSDQALSLLNRLSPGQTDYIRPGIDEIGALMKYRSVIDRYPLIDLIRDEFPTYGIATDKAQAYLDHYFQLIRSKR